MPELPEVETIARRLRDGCDDQPALVGLTITGGRLHWERTLAMPDPVGFYLNLPGQRIQQIGRRGKFLVFSLTRQTLLIHLRMSGDIMVKADNALTDRHTRLEIFLKGGWQLIFNDARKFGRAWLLDDPKLVLGRLGPEPLELSSRDFHTRLLERSRQLKPLLLDQSFLAGLGNIYTDEALHIAGLHPRAISCTLDYQQAKRLRNSIRKVLLEGIQRNGASIDWVYRGGEFQNYFQVYQRSGEPCLKCNTPIERISVGQRGTYFCPSCQKI